MLQIDASAYLLFALMLLTIPLEWVVSSIAAAIFHELCHCAAILSLGGRIHAVKIKVNGAVIETRISGTGRELACTLAGPAGSVLLLLFCRVFPKMAICGFVQGIANLIPVYPLDGGRILKCCLELAGVSDTEKILLYAKRITFLLITVLTAVLAGVFSSGKIFQLTAAAWILKGILRKRPCKQCQIRVQ